MTSLNLYWINCIGKFECLSFFAMVVSAVFLTVLIIIYMCIKLDTAGSDESSDEITIVTRWLRIFLIIFIISSIFQTIIPTKEELAVIYVLPKIANNSAVQKLPQNVVDLANDVIEKKIKDIRRGVGLLEDKK